MYKADIPRLAARSRCSSRLREIPSRLPSLAWCSAGAMWLISVCAWHGANHANHANVHAHPRPYFHSTQSQSRSTEPFVWLTVLSYVGAAWKPTIQVSDLLRYGRSVRDSVPRV